MRPTADEPGGTRQRLDVVGAISNELEALLAERVREAAALDTSFTKDIANRVAHFTLNGGKLVRAQLLWWAAHARDGQLGREMEQTVLRVAAAMELLQTCALVHDDVMDGSALRRGRPAMHADVTAQYPQVRAAGPEALAFGVSAAVLIGDLALTWADDVFAQTGSAGPVHQRARQLWRAMRCEMVAGQYLDLHAQALGSRSRTRALRIAYLKSARYSVELPLEMGAILGRTDAPTRHALAAAGRCAGIAFQLRDELLGVFGDPVMTGKPSGDDIRDGKLTCLTAIAFARARSGGHHTAHAALQHAWGQSEASDWALAQARDALIDTGARATVEAKIAHLTEQSLKYLAEADVTPAVRNALGTLLAILATDPAQQKAPI